jgi:cytochrome c peroxidase
MQVGSDGFTACASCHFHAGTDSRSRNTLNPGPDGAFGQGKKVNAALSTADFPFFRLADPDNRGTGGIDPNDPAVARRNDDVVGAQGIPLKDFRRLREGNPAEEGRHRPAATFHAAGRNVRQVTGRNTPSTINAVFNHTNFLDGRANHYFNGVSPFGYQDNGARIAKNVGGTLELLDLNRGANRLENASLASQAVGPPLNAVEMSWSGRRFPDLARKILPLRPLAGQAVSSSDGALGLLSRAPGKGLNATYGGMVQAAFRPELWNNASQRVDVSPAGALSFSAGTGGYSQMEANFSFFFGMAVMLYEATLVSDDSPFDRFADGDPTALTPRQQRGLTLFFSGATSCSFCHVGAEFTAVSITNTKNPLEPSVIEQMPMGDGSLANYDIGFYNIGVTPTAADPGRGGKDPFGQPLSFTRQYLDRASLPFPPIAQPGCLNNFLGDPPVICPPSTTTVVRAAVNGAFKTPGLRNVELTGPYFHNGSAATLRQVVDFYARGGNFREANMADLDPFITDIGALKGGDKEAERAALVDFLLSLTDERVRWERAPFDHPQLFVPDGHKLTIDGDPRRNRVLDDAILEIPAVGRTGRTAAQGPLRPFLSDGDPNFHYKP